MYRVHSAQIILMLPARLCDRLVCNGRRILQPRRLRVGLLRRHRARHHVRRERAQAPHRVQRLEQRAALCLRPMPEPSAAGLGRRAVQAQEQAAQERGKDHLKIKFITKSKYLLN